MASYDAQINILVAGQRNINNLLGQLNQVEDAIAQVESKWKVASAALQRTEIRLGARGTQRPRDERGRFVQDPDRQARLNALADRRAAVERLSRARAELLYETKSGILKGNAIRSQIEGNERILRQTERRIALESKLNTAVERLERRQSAYARGGGGSKLSEELQDRVRNIQATFQSVGGANAKNLSLVRSLATELGSIVELQNEVNRGTRLQSAGFYKAQGLERGIASLRERGVPASAFRTVGGQMRDYRSAVQRGNQPEAEMVARRIKENLDRLGRDLDKSFAELRKSQSVRLAARSWQTFFEDAASQALQIKQNAQNTKESWQVFFKDAANQALAIKQAGQNTKQSWKNFFEDAANQALSIKQNGQETKQAWRLFFEDAANQALSIKQNVQEVKQAWKSFFEDAANQALAIKQGAVETKNAWKLFFEDAASQALQVKQNARETKNSWQVFFEDAAGEANRLRSPMLQAKQSWQQFFIDAAEEAATARRKPVGAMTPEQRVAGGVLDPASLRQTRLNRVAQGRARQQAIGRAGSEGLIGGAFPLLFGQGAGASAGGFAGGVAGGLAGGGLGFGLSLLGTVIGTAVDEADALDKELAKVNASAKGVGNTSADVSKLASSLGIAKEEAVTLLAQFKQFGSAQIRKDLALVFGGGREAILERLESIVKEEDALQAIAAARKEIGNQEAISLLNTFKIQGSAQAQLVLREALLRISEKETIEEKKRITIQDRLLAMFASGGDGNFVNPAIFGEERAKEQRKAFEKERDQRRKNYDEAIKDSQEFFKKLDELSRSGKDKLGSDLLSAIDSRNEAIDNARKQREQQIADIRKQAVEAAARIEEDLADKRKQIEREIQDVRRNRADSAIDADIRFRELRGEDPGVIEAERELLAISREDRDARIELQRRLGDEESEQAKTIAEFQKGVAKQIQDANLASARAMGEIQSNYAKQVAKIIEEGSGKGGKRLAAAGELAAKYIERAALLQTRSNVTINGQPAVTIPRPKAVNGGLSYPGIQPDAVPAQFPPLDKRILELERQLQSSRKPGIGQQFTALLGAEGGFEDVAGLKPLPIQKMYQQIGRPFTKLYEDIQKSSTELWAKTRREIKQMLAPSPERTETVLKRAERVETVRQTWNPLEAESRSRLNQTNPSPRSKPSQASLTTLEGVVRDLSSSVFKRLNEMPGSAYGILGDLSDYLEEGEKGVLKRGIEEQLQKGVRPYLMPVGGNRNTGRGHLQQAVKDITAEFLGNEKIAPRGAAPTDPLIPLGGDSEWLKRFMEQTEPIQIIPGVQNRIEGASLPVEAFDVSKIATDFGQVVSASFMGGLLAQNSPISESQKLRDSQGLELKRRQPTAYPLPVIPSATATPPGVSGAAAATTQARKDLGAETLAALDDKKFASLKNYFAEVNAEGLAVNKNLIEQNRLLDAQLLLMGSGVEEGLARQLAGVENTYAARLKQLEGKRKNALEQGWDVGVVEAFYNAELKLLKKTTDEIANRTTEYAKQSEFLLSIASLNQQIAVTGMAEQAGFFGAGASAYTNELLRSGDAGQATELAQQTKALEAKQAVTGVQGEINGLIDSTNVAIKAAEGIGGAFGQAFQGLINGSMSAKEALASFFSSVSEAFLGMAAEIIAKQTTMIVLQTILKALGAVGSGVSPSAPGGDWMSAVSRMNPTSEYATGGAFANGIQPFAKGGTFTNSVVSSPTLFKFANGGTTQMGEMGEAGPEAIMPLSRGRGGRLGVDASGLREAMGRPPGGATGSPVLNMSFQSTTINGVEYVSRDQLEAAMVETRRQAAKEGANRGMNMTLDKIQNSPSTRSRVGIR